MSDKINLAYSGTIPFTDLQMRQMIASYKTGKSARQLAAIYGISQKSVLRRLHTLGADVRAKGRQHG